MKTILTAICLMMLCAPSFAETSLPKNITITPCGEECIEIHTRNDVVFRVHACGKLEKKEWKELSGNEDSVTSSYGGVWKSIDPGITQLNTVVGCSNGSEPREELIGVRGNGTPIYHTTCD